MQERKNHGWLIPATGSLALIPTVAGASGFALLEQSASRLGTAYAGTAAAADDATTVFFNPAGMTSLREPEAVVSASGIEITSEFRNDNGGDAGDWNFLPAASTRRSVSSSSTATAGSAASRDCAQRHQDAQRESVGCLAHH